MLLLLLLAQTGMIGPPSEYFGGNMNSIVGICKNEQMNRIRMGTKGSLYPTMGRVVANVRRHQLVVTLSTNFFYFSFLGRSPLSKRLFRHEWTIHTPNSVCMSRNNVSSNMNNHARLMGTWQCLGKEWSCGMSPTIMNENGTVVWREVCMIINYSLHPLSHSPVLSNKPCGLHFLF